MNVWLFIGGYAICGIIAGWSLARTARKHPEFVSDLSTKERGLAIVLCGLFWPVMIVFSFGSVLVEALGKSITPRSGGNNG